MNAHTQIFFLNNLKICIQNNAEYILTILS